MRARTQVARRRSRSLRPVGIATVLLLLSACGTLEPLSTEQALERLNVATTKVYAADGSLLADLHGEVNRDIIPIEDVPRHVRDAVVAIEDARFWHHPGIDLRAVGRALVRNIEDASRGNERLQGGSTVSQQLVKNLYFAAPDRTIERKLAEARVTLQFEHQYSKEQILEMYLNTIYFGRGLYGIQTAAQSYFGKPATELSLAEAGFLAGLIHEPASYDVREGEPPQRREERLRAGTDRRNLVLRRMAELGFAEREAAEAAAAEPLELRTRQEGLWRHPYFVDMVLRHLGVLRNSRSDRLDPRYSFLGSSFEERSRNVYRGGLRIYTTLDPKVQAAAEEAIATMLPERYERLSAALAAIEPRTGYIRALVGGRDYYPACEGIPEDEQPPGCRLAKVNLGLGDYGGGSGRQPGSAFKVPVLAAALERGIPLRSHFSGAAFTHRYPGGVWTVRNYEGSAGAGGLVEATVSSVNAAYARVLIDGVGEGDARLGAARVADLARRMGVPFPTRDDLRVRCGEHFGQRDDCIPADDVPAIALGAKEVSPLDLTALYSVLASDGVRLEPSSIVRITDASGKLLYEAETPRERVLSPGVARGVTHVLEQVVSRGTGVRARLGRPAAGKTGTSQQWRDAWFAGYVPQLAATVWVGNPATVPGSGIESMVPANGYPFRVTGGSFPAMIWQFFMHKALEGVPVERFPEPPRTIFSAEPTPRPPVPVPDLIGLSRSEAIALLLESQLTGHETVCLAPSAEEGTVVRQDPAAGGTAPAGSAVTICMSVPQLPERSPDGETAPESPEPTSSPSGESGEAEVPDVVGRARAQAHSELARTGFDSVAVRECQHDGEVPAGAVWKQNPPGGETARTGSTVTIWYQPSDC